MALMFEYKPGMSLTDPWPFTVVRSQPGYRFAQDGTVKQSAANILRDNHYINGGRTTLFEPSAINSCIQSQAWATSWANNQQVATNNASTAPDGTTTTATSLVPNAGTRPTANPYTQSTAVTITANEFLAGSCFVKQKGTYNGLVLFLADAPSANGMYVQMNLTTGAIISQSAVGTGVLAGVKIIPLAGGWFWIGLWGQISTATPGATSAFILTALYPDTTFSGTAVYDGVQGYYGWGAQLERNGVSIPGATPPTTYMPTTTVTSTARGADQMSTPWPFKIMPMWCYAAYYDLGMASRITSQFVLTITPNPAVDPQWIALFGRNSGAPGTSWISGAGVGGVGNSNRNTVDGVVVPAYGDFVEVFMRVLGTGQTLSAVRKNGGAISTNSTGPLGTVPFVDFPANPLLWFGYPNQAVAGPLAFTNVKIGADPLNITTLTQGAAV